MKAHDENSSSPGLFTSNKARQMGAEAGRFFERAVHCLDLNQVPAALRMHWGYEGVLFLKEIFDRIDLPPIDEIPNARAIREEEGNNNTTGLYRWRVPDTEIVIARIQEGQRQGEFLFASDIIPRLDEFVEKVKHLPFKSDDTVTPGFLKFYDTSPGTLLPPKWGQWIPAWSNAIFYFQTVWQWFLMALMLLIASLAVWILYRFTTGRNVSRRSARWAWGVLPLSS